MYVVDKITRITYAVMSAHNFSICEKKKYDVSRLIMANFVNQFATIKAGRPYTYMLIRC